MNATPGRRRARAIGSWGALQCEEGSAERSGTLRVTVLGKSPSWQDAAGACSGYLVEHDDLTLLLDCGNGVFAKLRSAIDYGRSTTSSSVISTPTTSSTCPVQLRAGQRGARSRSGRRLPGTPAAGRSCTYPPAGARCCGGSSAAGARRSSSTTRSRSHEYDGRRRACARPAAGPLPRGPALHRTYAVELATNGGRFIFGADCAPNEELIDFARDTDLLMVEATLPRPERHRPRAT